MIRPSRLPVFLSTLCGIVSLLAVEAKLTYGQTNTDAKPAIAEKATPQKGDSETVKVEKEKADGPEAGHSYHGEAFNEGARQKAYLMKNTGKIDFPATTKNPLAQKFINQGVGQLHGFWYFEAERSFRQAAALDPDCAIAYWGMAMANQSNTTRSKEFIKEAMTRKDKASDREKKYIEALSKYINATRTPSAKDKERKEAFLASFEDIAIAYPDDLEAKAFLGLQFYLNRSISKIPSYTATNAIHQEILRKNPYHPVHHYLIHLWDYKKPEYALKSAAMCGQSAPSIAHMWHMPGHIYSRLKRYNDAVFQQEASARVDHAHMIRDRVLPDQIHNFAHNNEWLIRNLLYTGRIHDAVDLAKNMTELPRHPKYNTISKRGKSAYYGRLRLFAALNQAEMWQEMIYLCNSPHLEPTSIDAEKIKRLQHLGRAYFQNGDLEEGRGIVKEVKDWQADQEKKKLAAQIKAEEKVIADAKKRIKKKPNQSEEDYDREVARQSAKEMKKAQDAAARPFATTIRGLGKALEEFEGQEAYAAGKFKEAYDLLKKAGGQDAMFLALLKLKAGDAKEAEKLATAYLPRHREETIPLAQAAYIQWEAGNKTAAKKTFAELRKLSGPIDLDTPIFARLAPMAKDMKLPADWRLPLEKRTDIGNRPDLDSLGPFRWHPSMAESWTLADKDGKTHSLADYRGKPVVVIFYLGFGCLHCVEQLKAFAPKAAEFEKQGISLIAISTESQAALDIALKNYNKEHKYAFPLVADPEHNVFKAYRAYDDFENQPLHGTYLIDAEGRVRWHDISYEPFMDADFVLKEADRLLKQTATGTDLVTVKTLKPVFPEAPARPAVAEKP